MQFGADFRFQVQISEFKFRVQVQVQIYVQVPVQIPGTGLARVYISRPKTPPHHNPQPTTTTHNAKIIQDTTNTRSRPNIPQLHPHDFKLAPIVAERLIAKGRTRGGDAVFEVVVEPEAVVTITVRLSVTSSNLKSRYDLPSANA